jgi:hypothetical protein
MKDMESNPKELCARIVKDLDNCTNSDKKDAYTYLDLKVKATPEGADTKGFLDPCLLTTGQTSRLLTSHAYDYLIPFSLYCYVKDPKSIITMVLNSLRDF